MILLKNLTRDSYPQGVAPEECIAPAMQWGVIDHCIEEMNHMMIC